MRNKQSTIRREAVIAGLAMFGVAVACSRGDAPSAEQFATAPQALSATGQSLVQVPADANQDPSVFLVATSNTLTVEDNVSLAPSSRIASDGAAQVGSHASIGLMDTFNSVFLRDSCSVRQLFADQAPTKQNNVTIGSLTIDPTRLPNSTQILINVPPAAGSPPPAMVEPGVTVNLSPGFNVAMHLKSGAIANLGAGVYSFNSLELEPSAHFRVHGAGSPTIIVVTGDLMMRGSLEVDGGAQNLLIVTGTTSDISVESPLVGTLIAPSAKVWLRTLSPATLHHQGAVLAQDVDLGPSTPIDSVPFAGWGLLTGSQTQIVAQPGHPGSTTFSGEDGFVLPATIQSPQTPNGQATLSLTLLDGEKINCSYSPRGSVFAFSACDGNAATGGDFVIATQITLSVSGSASAVLTVPSLPVTQHSADLASFWLSRGTHGLGELTVFTEDRGSPAAAQDWFNTLKAVRPGATQTTINGNAVLTFSPPPEDSDDGVGFSQYLVLMLAGQNVIEARAVSFNQDAAALQQLTTLANAVSPSLPALVRRSARSVATASTLAHAIATLPPAAPRTVQDLLLPSSVATGLWGELAIAAESTGTQAFIGSNGGQVLSTNSGANWNVVARNNDPPGDSGDPAVGWGPQAGFLLSRIKVNSGAVVAPPAGVPSSAWPPATGPSCGFSIQQMIVTPGGPTPQFNPIAFVGVPSTGVSVPGNANFAFFPDQEQMTVDPQLQAISGSGASKDQVYITWRTAVNMQNCTAPGGGTFDNFGMMCSIDGGQSFTNLNSRVRPGDFPRPTIANDGLGTVLIAYSDTDGLKLVRTASCAKGNQPAATAATGLVEAWHTSNAPTELPPDAGCPIAGLDRCPLAADHGVAADDTTPADVYVVFIRVSQAPGNPVPTTPKSLFYDVVLAHSPDGGLHFPDKLVLNAQNDDTVRKHPRYLPGVSVTRGRVNVSWYERGNGGANVRDDSTTFMRATAILSALLSPPIATLVITDGPTAAATQPVVQRDPACMIGFPAGTILGDSNGPGSADLCRNNVGTAGTCLDNTGLLGQRCVTGKPPGSFVCLNAGLATPALGAASCTSGAAFGTAGACPLASDTCIADPQACPSGQTCAVFDGFCRPAGATTTPAGAARCDSTGTNAGTGACTAAGATCVRGSGIPTYGDYNLNASAGGRFFLAWTSGVDLSNNPLFFGTQPVTRIFADSFAVQQNQMIRATLTNFTSFTTGFNLGNHTLNFQHPTDPTFLTCQPIQRNDGSFSSQQVAGPDVLLACGDFGYYAQINCQGDDHSQNITTTVNLRISDGSNCPPQFQFGNAVNDEQGNLSTTVTLDLGDQSQSTTLFDCHRGFDLDPTVGACDRNKIQADVTIANVLAPTHN